MIIKEFLGKLRKRLEQIDLAARNNVAFFDCLFKGSFGRAIDAIPDVPKNWRELSDAACRNSSEAHPDIYQEATAISVAFSQEAKESLGIELAPIAIQSPTDMMVAAGLLKIQEGPDGKRYVKLSEKGERVAKEVEAEINSQNN